jgi:hypothetical protein
MFLPNKSIVAQQSKLSLLIEYVDNPPIQKTFWLFGRKTLKIKVYLVNNSQNTYYCEKMVLNSNLNFKITDALGKETQVSIPIVINPQIDANFFKKLSPQDKYSVLVDVFDMSKYDIETNKKYNLSAIYSANKIKYFPGDKEKLFQGIINSNVLILEK